MIDREILQGIIAISGIVITAFIWKYYWKKQE